MPNKLVSTINLVSVDLSEKDQNILEQALVWIIFLVMACLVLLLEVLAVELSEFKPKTWSKFRFSCFMKSTKPETIDLD